MAVEKVEQVRSRNFQLLFAQFKEAIRQQWPDEPDRGMLKRFAERLGMNKIYLSQINNDRKIIGTETRDKIEAALKLPAGWMDTDHSQEALLETDDARAFQEAVMALYSQAPEASKSALLKVFSALMAGKPLEDVR
jgi:transcriptional regulator with XRE-family HTH domain